MFKGVSTFRCFDLFLGFSGSAMEGRKSDDTQVPFGRVREQHC